LTNFAFVGDGSCASFQLQEAERGFRRRLGAVGRGVRVFSPELRKGGARAAASLANLAAWLGSQSEPVGLLAASDTCGWRVLEACRLAGLTPALDVAVIAIEYDELLCELADPPLTSVALDGEACGYRGAQALRGMMQGDRRRRRLTVGAVGVIHRASTQKAPIEDRHVAEAVHLIRRLAGQQIGVNDIVDALHISRRALEMKFRKTFGYGPYDELQRVRLDRAQRLLLETDLSIPQVASAAGYSSASYLAQVFQRRLGESPAQFRRAKRAHRLAPTANNW
jgi:LacI family transcriptional regulator